MRRYIYLSLASLFLDVVAHAYTYTWTGNATTPSWLESDNWESGNIPPAGATNAHIVLDNKAKSTTYARYDVVADTLTLASTAQSSFSVVGDTLTINQGINANSTDDTLYLYTKMYTPNDQTWNVVEDGHLRVRSNQNTLPGQSITIEKTGKGTLYFDGDYYTFLDFSGSIKLTEGTLALAQQKIFRGIPNIIMNGGTLTTNGYDESMGSLTLTADSTISLNTYTYQWGGINDHSIINFADSSANSWDGSATLYITEWDGNLAGGGNDQLYFGSSAAGLTAAQIAQIKFVDPNGLSGLFDARMLSTGEIVPVPEPATMALGGALAGLLGLNERRRRKAKADQDSQN